MGVQYADDVVLYSDRYLVNAGLRQLEISLKTTSILLKNLGLELSIEKTKLCIFSHLNKELQTAKRRDSSDPSCKAIPSIRIGKNQIYSSHEVKFLGLRMNSSLKWNSHISHLIRSCYSPLKTINCLRGTWWGG